MKKLLTLVLIGALVLSALPIATFAFVQPGPEFCLQINGSFTPLVLKGISYCTTFDVSVIALEFEDLYAYEWTVTWEDEYFTLVDYEVKHIHSADFVLVSELLDGPDADTRKDTYHQAVTAVAPAEGFTGTAAMANLQFHVINEPQWTGPGEYTEVDFIVGEGDTEESEVTKAVDSCTEDIPHSDQGSYVEFRPKQPTIKMLPPVIYKSVVDETFEVQFEIQDVVKMKSFHFTVTWDPIQLETDAQNVWIKDFLPPPYEEAVIHIFEGYLTIDVSIPCEKPCINGTGELFGIRFTALNPWDDGIYASGRDVDIPPYDFYDSDDIPHPIWFPEVCYNYINIAGFIDKIEMNGEIVNQPLGTLDGVRVKAPNVNPNNPPTYTFFGSNPADKYEYSDGVQSWTCQQGGFVIGYYEFRPIPGDLDLDGHCDIIDLSAMAKYYGRFLGDGKSYPPYANWAEIADFDLNGDTIIDVFDVVIVAKNICRTEPDPNLPHPILDP